MCEIHTKDEKVQEIEQNGYECTFKIHQPKRSKREDLINSKEYKDAGEIKKAEFRIALMLRESLKLD